VNHIFEYTCSLIIMGKLSVAEPHHFYAAPALGKNLDLAAASTLQ
jgi:hypothetical protein